MKRHTAALLVFFGFYSNFAISGDHKPGTGGMTGWDAFGEIQKGNKRFVENNPEHAKQDADTRAKLATGQSPHTIILSCSDSRVAPELVFDQGLGEIFPIRIAGNVPTTEAIASIEYAVEHLGSKLLVVMGHESCGAVKAALTTPASKTAGSASLDKLLSQIRPNVEKAGRALAADDKVLRAPVKAHVHAVIQDVLKNSKIIRHAVAKDQLVLAEGIYSLNTGKVEFWDVGEKFAGLGESHDRRPANKIEKSAPKEHAEKAASGWGTGSGH